MWSTQRRAKHIKRNKLTYISICCFGNAVLHQVVNVNIEQKKWMTNGRFYQTKMRIVVLETIENWNHRYAREKRQIHFYGPVLRIFDVICKSLGIINWSRIIWTKSQAFRLIEQVFKKGDNVKLLDANVYTLKLKYVPMASLMRYLRQNDQMGRDTFEKAYLRKDNYSASAPGRCCLVPFARKPFPIQIWYNHF